MSKRYQSVSWLNTNMDENYVHRKGLRRLAIVSQFPFWLYWIETRPSGAIWWVFDTPHVTSSGNSGKSRLRGLRLASSIGWRKLVG